MCDKPLDLSALDPKDIRRTMPRFEPGNYAANLALLPAYTRIAREVGCSPAQLALAWLLHKGDHIVPIPGTTQTGHLAEDLESVGVTLEPATIARVEAVINQHTVRGARYGAQAASEVDTESFP